jgi:DNA-binding transcriptional MerR regulator
MKERRLRISEIAGETGIPEQTVRAYIKEFGDLIPAHTVGRVKLYHEPAVNLIRKIDALTSEGSSPEDIARALQRGGAQRSHAGARSRPRPQKVQPLQQAAPPAPLPAPPLPSGEHLRGLRDTIALQEQQIKAIHRRLEEIKQADEHNLREIAGLHMRLDEVQAAQARQIEIIEQWMAYYEQRLDMYEASVKDAMERMRQWIDYLEEGLKRANEPITAKILRILR